MNKELVFAGTKITPENRWDIHWQRALWYKQKYPEATQEECIEYAKNYINREKKHYESFLKGRNYFTYKGERFPVMQQDRLERFQQMAIELEKKYGVRDEEE